MHRIYCSTGALIGRPNGRDYTRLADCAKQISCDGFEFLMYEDWYDSYEAVAAFMIANRIHTPVFHVEKQVGELISRNQAGDTARAIRLFDINCKLAALLHANMMVLHLWGGLDSDKDMAHNIETYTRLRDMAKDHSLALTVENVVCNISDPFTHMFQLVETFPDITFTFDTKMAQFHSQLDRLYELSPEWIAAHITHMHINDYGGGYKDWANLKTLHLGDGNIDFPRVFDCVRKHYNGDFTVEATSFDKSGTIHFDEINADIGFIKSFLK